MAVAFSARTSPTFEAAKGVPFLAPLNHRDPLEDQKRTLPFRSLTTALVLLNVDSIESMQVTIFFFVEREPALERAPVSTN